MYNADAYRFPASHGVADSYVKYQMYSNPPGYNTHAGHYGYDNGNAAARSSMYDPVMPVSCEYQLKCCTSDNGNRTIFQRTNSQSLKLQTGHLVD